MKKHLRTTIAVTLLVMTVLILACAGCSYLPDPTTRTVTPADIAGTYTYVTDDDNVVTVHFNADGTIEIENSAQYSDSGTWTLDGAEISFDIKDRVLASGWYVTDTEDGGFAIMGGEGDPDGWEGMQRVP